MSHRSTQLKRGSESDIILETCLINLEQIVSLKGGYIYTFIFQWFVIEFGCHFAEHLSDFLRITWLGKRWVSDAILSRNQEMCIYRKLWNILLDFGSEKRISSRNWWTIDWKFVKILAKSEEKRGRKGVAFSEALGCNRGSYRAGSAKATKAFVWATFVKSFCIGDLTRPRSKERAEWFRFAHPAEASRVTGKCREGIRLFMKWCVAPKRCASNNDAGSSRDP